MKTPARLWLFASLLLVALVVAILLVGRRSHNHFPTESLSTTGAVSYKAQPSASSLQSVTMPNVQSVADSATIWNAAVRTPIQFYGKVVDESGTAIPHAEVAVSVHDRVFQSGSRISKLTDGNGRFDVIAHGLGLGVSVSKEGFYSTNQSVASFGYAPGAGTGPPHTDLRDPAVFVLRRKGAAEPLITFRKNFSIAIDGMPIRVSLSTATLTTDNNESVELRTRRENTPDSKDHYSWTCSVSVPGGGIMERTDELRFEAPKEGYEREAVIKMPASAGPLWRSQVARGYFIHFSDGNYARIDLTISTGGDHFARIASYLNPSGSRNLEFDPKKVIRR